MKRTAIFMVTILFCSAIARGCIEEVQEPATTADETSKELTHPVTGESDSLLVYCGAGVRKPMFADFVASPEGKAIFGKPGFTAYPNEKYEEQ